MTVYRYVPYNFAKSSHDKDSIIGKIKDTVSSLTGKVSSLKDKLTPHVYKHASDLHSCGHNVLSACKYGYSPLGSIVLTTGSIAAEKAKNLLSKMKKGKPGKKKK